MQKSLILLCLLALACLHGTVGAQPLADIHAVKSQVIWGGTGTAADTLGQLASDSVSVTSAFNPFGYSYVVLVVTSSGSDSMAVPVIQTQMQSGAFTGQGGTLNIPPTGATIIGGSSTWQTTTLASSSPRQCYALFNGADQFGATPVPFINTGFRWRLKSTNARRVAAGAQVSSGQFTITAYAWK